MSRDALRSRVYAAEQQVTTALSRAGERIDFFGSQLTPPPERHFNTLTEVRAYVAEVLADHHVVHTWGYAPAIHVRHRASDSMAHYEYESATIAIPTGSEWAMRELVVLHEVAHHLLAHVDSAAAPHGPEFASMYIQLVSWRIGPEAGLLLMAAFDASGVEVSAVTPA